MFKIGLTGHRTERLRGKEQEVKEWIHRVLDILTAERRVELWCGCAEGADEIFGMCADYYPYDDIYLTLVLPFRDYRAGDPAMEELKKRANRMTTMSPYWDRDVDDLRDKSIAENCDILLVVWDGKPSKGVCSTIKYAKAAGKPIIYCPQSIWNINGKRLSAIEISEDEMQSIKDAAANVAEVLCEESN